MKKHWLSLVTALPFALCIILILCYSDEISAQTIIEYTPKNPFAATLILLLMYAAKSVSIVFPLIILEIAGGHLFSPIPAIIINMLGILVCHSISYWIGHFVGATALDKLIKKHALLDSAINKQKNNAFFMCFFLRTLYCLPGDVVSMYLGTVSIPFNRYIIASTLGSLPRTILATLFGACITKPFSPMFWISFISITIFSSSSFLVYYVYTKKL